MNDAKEVGSLQRRVLGSSERSAPCANACHAMHGLFSVKPLLWQIEHITMQLLWRVEAAERGIMALLFSLPREYRPKKCCQRSGLSVLL